MFTEKEIAYLQSQPLARLATVSVDLQPDAVPVGFEFDGQWTLFKIRRSCAETTCFSGFSQSCQLILNRV
jgi:hypothetical protein